MMFDLYAISFAILAGAAAVTIAVGVHLLRDAWRHFTRPRPGDAAHDLPPSPIPREHHVRILRPGDE